MKVKRVIRIELTEDDAQLLESALKDMEEAAKGSRKFNMGEFWWTTPGTILEDMLTAIRSAK